MKTSLIVLVVLTQLCTLKTNGMLFRVAISHDESNRVTYSVNNIPISESAMKGILGKIAAIDTNIVVYVDSAKSVMASDLTALLDHIQSSGLHCVTLTSPGQKDDKNGHFRLSLDLTMKPIGTCMPESYLKNGFEEVGQAGRNIDEVYTSLPEESFHATASYTNNKVTIALDPDDAIKAAISALTQYLVLTNGSTFTSGYVSDSEGNRIPINRVLIATNNLNITPNILDVPFSIQLYTNDQPYLKLEYGDLYLKIAKLDMRAENEFELSLYATGKGHIGGVTIEYNIRKDGDAFIATPLTYHDP